ncbi:unnamed protein product [Rhizoctonia solani]|uniref:DASH complex subunit DAD3 n=1 Tax=Rhizoctonia solani TaxID=456999 RepID=A0A8H3A3Q1_9AGAM|nr:unnamed protein product [Rhizoctonia solani]CAE6530152.1 unnamed protein product [Rhizoctonia solani]
MLASVSDEANIYAGHPQLTPLEADVLWEYAKLARTLKTLVVKSREMSERSDDALLAKLRAAEMKMGLVHTLVSVSSHSHVDIVASGRELVPCCSASVLGFGSRVIRITNRPPWVNFLPDFLSFFQLKASVWAVLVKQEEEFGGEEGETTFQP